MKFQYRECPEVPCLGWGAVLAKGDDTVIVYHGDQVETREEGFVEGAWDGPFSELPNSASAVVCGTGGSIRAGCLEFWSGTDKVFPIYCIVNGGKLFVSNSIVFVMVLAGDEPDLSYPFYYDDLIRIVRTGRSIRYGLRTASGAKIRVEFSRIVNIDRDLRLSTKEFRNGDSFHDYQSYFELIAGSVDGVLKNAMSEQRRFPYEPVAACSGGYDANAGAALAARAGCRRAMTFTGTDRWRRYSDSGSPVADALGLSCVERDGGGFQDAGDLSEYCVVPHAMHCPYAVFEDVLSRTILVTGIHGDNVWAPNRVGMSTSNRATWVRLIGGYGLSEHRLRVGYLVFTPCRIGSIYTSELRDITFSAEMAPWRIGGFYDRPIPRRIVEESGVPRNAFGLNKMASAQAKFAGQAVQSTHIGPDYERFMARRSMKVNAIVDFYWRSRQRLRRFLLLHLSPRDRRFVRETRLERLLGFFGNRPQIFDWYYTFNLQYCFEALKGRYKINTEPSIPGSTQDLSRTKISGWS